MDGSPLPGMKVYWNGIGEAPLGRHDSGGVMMPMLATAIIAPLGNSQLYSPAEVYAV